MMLQDRAIRDLRAMARKWFIDTIEIWHPSSSVLGDDLIEDVVAGEMLWTGPARISPPTGPTEQPVGEGVIVMRDADFLIPHDAPLPWRDDEVRVVSSRDPALVDRWFRITDVRVFSQQMTRRFSAVQAQPSRQWRPTR